MLSTITDFIKEKSEVCFVLFFNFTSPWTIPSFLATANCDYNLVWNVVAKPQDNKDKYR